MKKVLLGIFALSCISMAVETNVYLRAGGDISGEFDVLKAGVSGVLDVSVNESIDVNDKDADGFGWEIAVEATREIYPNLEFGFGVAFQDHDRPENGVSYSEHDIGVANPDLGNINLSAYATGYNSIPLYLTMKYNFDAINNFRPYVKANLGYSFNDLDDEYALIDAGLSFSESNTALGANAVAGAKLDIDNGLYYGIGVGVEYNDFIVDLMYQVNKAEGSATILEMNNGGQYINAKVNGDFDYSRFTLSFGYKFNI